MTKFGLVICAALIALGGCASRDKAVGTLGGAAVGSAATGGSVLGTAAGGVVGYEAGKTYEEKHK